MTDAELATLGRRAVGQPLSNVVALLTSELAALANLAMSGGATLEKLGQLGQALIAFGTYAAPVAETSSLANSPAEASPTLTPAQSPHTAFMARNTSAGWRSSASGTTPGTKQLQAMPAANAAEQSAATSQPATSVPAVPVATVLGAVPTRWPQLMPSPGPSSGALWLPQEGRGAIATQPVDANERDPAIRSVVSPVSRTVPTPATSVDRSDIDLGSQHEVGDGGSTAPNWLLSPMPEPQSAIEERAAPRMERVTPSGYAAGANSPRATPSVETRSAVPIEGRPVVTAAPDGAVQTGAARPDQSLIPAGDASEEIDSGQSEGVVMVDNSQFSRWMIQQLEQHASRPGAMTTGIDPRMSAAYPGAPTGG